MMRYIWLGTLLFIPKKADIVADIAIYHKQKTEIYLGPLFPCDPAPLMREIDNYLSKYCSQMVLSFKQF